VSSCLLFLQKSIFGLFPSPLFVFPNPREQLLFCCWKTRSTLARKGWEVLSGPLKYNTQVVGTSQMQRYYSCRALDELELRSHEGLVNQIRTALFWEKKNRRQDETWQTWFFSAISSTFSCSCDFVDKSEHTNHKNRLTGCTRGLMIG